MIQQSKVSSRSDDRSFCFNEEQTLKKNSLVLFHSKHQVHTSGILGKTAKLCQSAHETWP
jgi:hypothetical protein